MTDSTHGASPPPPEPSGPDALQGRPFLLLVSSHWASLLGLFLVGTALITWLFVLPLQVRGHADNPYIGIVIFVLVPLVFFAGLALVPLGVWLARRRVRKRLALAITDRRAAVRRLAYFLGATTVVNVLVGTQLTYRAVEHMESVQFCGQSCHVMTPEYVGHQGSPHARVTCVECHVGPGVTGWVESKMNGTRQLFEVAFNSYPRPIPGALETDRLVPARQTCEQCHWPDKFGAMKLRLIAKFAEDEANTETNTVLTMMVGGSGTGGIHGQHFSNGIEIRYAAGDKKRTTIPLVEYTNSQTGVSRTYLASGAKPEEAASLPKFTMQCVDCHNRPTHTFQLPARALDESLSRGLLPASLPHLKKKAMEVVKAEYRTSAEAAQQIPAAIVSFYEKEHPEVYAKRAADIQRAGQTVASIYARNVFPELKVGWGTYPNHLGHEDFPGCFRCHDEDHKAADGRTITQDCSACHEAVAMDEASPEILKTLGLSGRLAAIKKE
ncbi:MAG TPA: NapC/NirT family cytochrome c [Vicinamibacteria bacterium]